MELTLINSILVPILFSVPLIFLYLYKFKPGRENASESQPTPPGSNGWPLIGETMEYLSTTKNCVAEHFIQDRKKKYSSKVFKTSLLGQQMVFLCSADGNKFLFSNENKLFTSWWPSSVDKILDNQSESKSEEALKVRNFVAPFLKPDTLRKFVGVMDEKAKEHVEKYWYGKRVLKVHPLTKDLTFKLACMLLLGTEDEETIARLQVSFEDFSVGLLSLPIDLPGTNFRRAIKAARELRKDFEAMIKQWKNDISVNGVSTSKGIFSQQLESGEQSQIFSESDMAMRILALLSASYDNISTTMTFVMKYLAEMPDIYQNVLREQREIAKGKGAEESLTWDDIQKMRYSWNVVCEVLRLHPPSSGAFREVMTNFTYDGFLIPKGWKAHWNVFATHKSPEYFPNPSKFDPSRFEGNNLVPYSYIPFGGGPHMCPGKEYARIAILALVHNVVIKFKLEKVLPYEKIIGLPTLKPAEDLPLRLNPHKL